MTGSESCKTMKLKHQDKLSISIYLQSGCLCERGRNVLGVNSPYLGPEVFKVG